MQNGKSDLLDIEMKVHHRTNKGILVSDDGDRRRAVWLPLELVELEEKANNHVVVTLPSWLAQQKELV
jgi:hypothetical protein